MERIESTQVTAPCKRHRVPLVQRFSNKIPCWRRTLRDRSSTQKVATHFEPRVPGPPKESKLRRGRKDSIECPALREGQAPSSKGRHKKCFSVKTGNTQERRRYSSFSEARTQRDRDLWDNITTTHDNLFDPNHHHTKSKRQAPWSESKIVHVDRNMTWRRSSKEPGTLLSFSERFTPWVKLMQKNHIRDVRRDGGQKSTCTDKEWAR